MHRVWIALVAAAAWSGLAYGQKEVAHSETFGDWRVELLQDAWGDEKEIVLLEAGGASIYINPKFGFVIQRYDFVGLRDSWPYCDVTQLAYRIDDEAPRKTGMGGKAATGGSCASMRMPGYMLEDMRSGVVMELRAGSNNARRSVSLIGFSDAWDRAASLSEKPPRVDTWMQPY